MLKDAPGQRPGSTGATAIMLSNQVPGKSSLKEGRFIMEHSQSTVHHGEEDMAAGG